MFRASGSSSSGVHFFTVQAASGILCNHPVFSDTLTITAGSQEGYLGYKVTVTNVIVNMSGRVQLYEYKAFAVQTCKFQAKTVCTWVRDYRIRRIKTIKVKKFSTTFSELQAKECYRKEI